MPKTPPLPAGLEQIRAALEHAVRGIEVELVAQLTKAYRAQSDRSFQKLLEVAKDPKQTGYMPRPFSNYDQWAKLDKERAEKKVKGKGGVSAILRGSANTFEELREIADFLVPTYYHADREAKESFENARDSFVAKNLRKFKEVLGKRTDVEDVQVSFSYRSGVFEGTVVVKLSDSTLTGHVSLKYVVRYTPRVTPYYQYPLIFSAVVKGKAFRSLSEEELRIMLGGGTSEQYQAEKVKEAIDAGFCPMSRKDVPSGMNGNSRYLNCPSCGAFTSIQNWKFRKHKTVAAEKAATASKLTDSGFCPMSREKVPADVIETIGPVDMYKDPKALCRSCGQQVRLDADRDWIRDQFLVDGYPSKGLVKKAKYLRHKVSK